MDPNETRRRVSQIEDDVRSRADPPGVISATIHALLFIPTQEERIRLLRQLAVIHETAANGNLEAAINTLGEAYRLAITSCISEQQLQVGCELVRLHRQSGDPIALQRASELERDLEVLCITMEQTSATARKLLS